MRRRAFSTGFVPGRIRGTDMDRAIDNFLPSWQHARGLTMDFIRAVPDER